MNQCFPSSEMAQLFQHTDQLPYRSYIERWTFYNELKSLKKTMALDLACGQGFYLDLLLSLNFSPVIGVDSAPEIATIAKDKYRQNKKVTIIQDSAEQFSWNHPFQVITAGFLLNYCESTEHLKALCKNLYQLLASDGTLLITVDLQGSYTHHDFDEHYGDRIYHSQPLNDGDTFKLTFLTDPEIDIYSTHYSVKTVNQAFTHAGFKSIEWIPVTVDPAGELALGKHYWTAILQNPLFGFLKIKK